MELNQEQNIEDAKKMFAGSATDLMEAPVIETPETTIVEPPAAPVVEPPVTPAVEPKVETPVTPPVVDYNSWLKEQTGYQSVEDIKTLAQKAAQVDQLTPKIKELEERPTFKTDFGKVADELAAKGVKPETIARFHALDLTALTPLDKLKLDMEVNNPTVSKQDIELYLNTKYDTSDESLSDGEKATRRIELEKESANASERLKSHIYQAFNPQQTVDPAIMQKEQNRLNYWQSNVGKIGDDVFSTTLQGKMKLQGANGVTEVAHDFAYQLPAEAKEAINKEFNEVLLSPANAGLFTPDENGVANARATKENLVWIHYGKDILKQAMNYAVERESKIHEHYANVLHNPNTRALPNGVQGVKSESDQANEGALSFLSKQG